MRMKIDADARPALTYSFKLELCKVCHQSKSATAPQRVAQITFAASAALEADTLTHRHMRTPSINHTHRVTPGTRLLHLPP